MNKKLIAITFTSLALIALLAVFWRINTVAVNKSPRKFPIHKNQCKASIASMPQKGVTKEKVIEKNLSLKEAYYYDVIESTGEVICRLCPHKCILREGETGDCQVRANIEGKLRTLVYARPITMHIDPIEKKPFFHFYPKQKTLSVATAGCNLRCLNCQNWQISQLSPFEMTEVDVVTPKQLVNLAKKYNANILSYTYNDPVVFFEYVLETAKLAKKEGIKNTLVTAGYINEEPIKELSQVIDAATVDIKGMTNKFYSEFNTGELDPVLKAIKIMKENGVWLEISYLVIPGENDSKEDFTKFSTWVRDNCGAETPVHFLRFFPQFRMKSIPATPLKTLQNAAKTAKENGLKYIYLGNVRDAETDDTFCPNCGKKIIKRDGYKIQKLLITNGKCNYCNHPINGIWE